MDEKKKSINDLGPGIEVLEGGIKTTGAIKGGGCICTPGGKILGADFVNGCWCGCSGYSASDANGDANDALST